MAQASHQHAQLLLQLYDLRREKVLRRARDFVQRDLKFKDFKDYRKRYPEGSKEARFVGMVLGYWDLACTLVVKGLIDEDLFNSTNFEHVSVWFKVKPLADAWRKQYKYPEMMTALESVASSHAAAAMFGEQPKAKPVKQAEAKKPKPPEPDEDDEDEDDD